MKLESKYLSGYLPFELKVKYEEGFHYGKSHISGIDLEGVKIKGINLWVLYKNLKPILRPLSDLTKEIEVNGEKFVPFEELEFLYKDFYFAIGNENELIIKYKNSNMYVIISEYNNIIQKLFEWHFDLFELIKNGLAIDINTLK